MLTPQSKLQLVSWEEFGMMVDDLTEKLDMINVRAIAPHFHNHGANVLVHVLANRLGVPVALTNESTTVAIHNLNGQPDCVITEYESEDEVVQLYHKPKFSYQSSVVDVEGNMTQFVFPWSK